MEKKYIVGGLAILGAIALVAYLRKPKRNSEGFFSANGTRLLVKESAENAYGSGCAWCKPAKGGSLYHTGTNKTCKKGDRCSTPYSF